MQDILATRSTKEFYKEIVDAKDDLFNFAEDYEPIQGFFQGEQKHIFDNALSSMKIYDDSKNYIVNRELKTR